MTGSAPAEITFEAFYAERYRWAVRLVYGMTGDAGLAEQITQDAFAKLAERFAKVEYPVTYLRTSLVNAVRSHGRRLKLERRHTEHRPDSFTPDHLVELVDSLLQLPQRQRTAIVLRYLEDLNDHEIADLLGCRLPTVRSLIHRGLASLRKVLT